MDGPAPPRVSDGTVYRVLEHLLVLDGERLSYRALDVEQIGSVYETLMGFELRVATGRSVAVRPDHVVVDLDALLTLAPGERAKRLKDESRCDVAGAVLEALKTATAPESIVVALGRRVSPRTPAVLPPGAMFLQPTEERRRSGSHYTPRSLTEPIVRTTLPIAQMKCLIDKHPENTERIFPYIGGEEVNENPTHAHRRYVINFGELTEAEARRWPTDLRLICMRALLTSANFTDAAMNRNIEAGLLVHDGSIARALSEQFDSLVTSGALRRLPSLLR